MTGAPRSNRPAFSRTNKGKPGFCPEIPAFLFCLQETGFSRQKPGFGCYSTLHTCTSGRSSSTTATGWRPAVSRPGYSLELGYVDFFYEADAEGQAGRDGHSEVRLNVSKLTKSGYN